MVVLLRGKSWRAKLNECVQWGEEYFLLKGEVVNGAIGNKEQLAVRYHVPSKKLRIEENGAPASVVSFYTHYPFILFVSEDSFLLSQGPASRRNFVNQALISHQQYISSLVQYHRSLKQRNMALRSARKFQDIENWTDILVEHALTLWRHRENFTNFINSQINDMNRQLSGENNQFAVRLAHGVNDTNKYKEELYRAFPHE